MAVGKFPPERLPHICPDAQNPNPPQHFAHFSCVRSIQQISQKKINDFFQYTGRVKTAHNGSCIGMSNKLLYHSETLCK